MKDYLIYLAPDCHECLEIQSYIKDNNIKVSTELLSKEEWTTKGVFAFPALFSNNEIIAYGSDIIKFLK